MHGAGHADDLAGLQMHGNKADAVPCERLRQNFFLTTVIDRTSDIFFKLIITHTQLGTQIFTLYTCQIAKSIKNIRGIAWIIQAFK